jgi:hypothetical protein
MSAEYIRKHDVPWCIGSGTAGYRVLAALSSARGGEGEDERAGCWWWELDASGV